MNRIQRLLQPGSVRTRLTFWYLLTLGVTLALFAVFVFGLRARTLHRELDGALEVRGYKLLNELRPALLDGGTEGLARDPRATRVPLAVREADGTTLFRSPAFPPLDENGERILAVAARAGAGRVSARSGGGDPLRIVTVPVTGKPLVLQVSASVAPVRRTLWYTALTLAGALVLVLTVAGFGSHVTTSRALAPVDQIVGRVQEIQASRPGDRLEISADSDEIERLVLTLNDMLDRIDASIRGARRFAADASHEIQTPLAAMRAIVETSLAAGCPSGKCTPMMEDLLAEVGRLSALVRDLRLIALADAGQLMDHREPIDLSSLTAECCDIARAVAEDRHVEVRTVLRDGTMVLGSALHLRRVVLNLTQNAIRYSPPASAIVVQVDRANAFGQIIVHDQGCGIDTADLPHIFKPFYRADPARARDTGGTGLGLALVDQIVRAHGGRVGVTSTPGLGSTFSVFLPLVPPA